MSVDPAALREQVRAAFPEAVAPTTPKPAPAAGRQKSETPPDLLATDDLVVYAAALPDVIRYLRDTLGFTYLSNITATDYLAAGIFEVIYHLYRVDGGTAFTLKTRVSRASPNVPSITPFWLGADFQEREAFDLYGVRFDGHPDLRRIYMWDEFEGFPMRKDFPKQGDKYFGGNEE